MPLPFTHPWFLLPAALLALVALGLGLWAQSRPGVGVRVVGQRPWLLGLGTALMLLGAGLGLAEPRYGSPEVPRLTVQVVVDASRSMTVRDMAGKTRWEAALNTLDRLWAQPRPGLRFGLDLLTGDTLPLMPPGQDLPLLRDALRAVTPGDLGSPGTSLGRGLPQILAAIDPKTPTVLLLLSDGEETWEASGEALLRATEALKKASMPLYVVPLGQAAPQTLEGSPDQKPLVSTAQPTFLEQLAQASGGRAFTPQDDLADFFHRLAQGKEALPVARSLQPSHPEWGAWLALAGLGLWLLAAGKPLRAWRPILGLFVALNLAPQGRAEWPVPPSVKAWLAQSALDRGDLTAAQRWKPSGHKPLHRLLAAQIELKSQAYPQALDTLAPLLGQGVPRPVPEWRAPALLLAAKAHLALNQRAEAQALLERLIQEQPGREEAIHNLQTLLKDAPPPPKTPPPPPPPRPSMGAQQDELEGMKQRLPQKPKPQGGVKDL
ncbi:MAG: VWA domain-containing protein [Firmicutes bacterium]|nr:VWA domain-containing protein [Bacillota bacterium]